MTAARHTTPRPPRCSAVHAQLHYRCDRSEGHNGFHESNMDDFPFGALIDSKISGAEYCEVRDVEEIRAALDAIGGSVALYPKGGLA